MKYARAMLLHSTVMFMQLRNSINIPAEHAAHNIFKHFRLQERNRFRAHKRMHNSRALQWNNTEVCPTHTKRIISIKNVSEIIKYYMHICE